MCMCVHVCVCVRVCVCVWCVCGGGGLVLHLPADLLVVKYLIESAVKLIAWIVLCQPIIETSWQTLIQSSSHMHDTELHPTLL